MLCKQKDCVFLSWKIFRSWTEGLLVEDYWSHYWVPMLQASAFSLFCLPSSISSLPHSSSCFNRKQSVSPTLINPGWGSWPELMKHLMLFSAALEMKSWDSYYHIYWNSLKSVRNHSQGKITTRPQSWADGCELRN